MDQKVAELLKDQVNKEFFSAYLYLAYSNYYYEKTLDGFGHWFDVQAREELDHALKFLKYLQDNSEPVTLGAIEAPDANFSNIREPLVAALKHEKYVTGLIHHLYGAAKDASDYRCCQFLEWFVAEQGEEEKNASDLVAKYDLFGGDPKGLYLLNAELKGRPEATTGQTATE
ncbi:MAG: ferritin [Desulfovibrio sp.]|nr:ferritin [Desulfovibrio sp.]